MIEKSILSRLQSHGFPRIANQFQICCGHKEIEKVFMQAFLWDVVIVDPVIDGQYLGANGTVRSQNPNTVLLAYFSAGDTNPHRRDPFHRNYHDALDPGWLLKDVHGQTVPLFQFPNKKWTLALNPTSSVQEFLPQYLAGNLFTKELVDGIFYDWLSTQISWLNNARPPRSGRIDIDSDGKADSANKLDQAWADGMREMLEHSRAIFPPGTMVIGNAGWNTGKDYSIWLNGIMIEQFLEGAKWRNDRFGWGAIMQTYSHYQKQFYPPPVSIIMANSQNAKNFQQMRFALCSTLLFDGYFCFTNRKTAYATVRWYDEYSVDLRTGKAIKSLEHKGYLGQPLSKAYRMDNPSRLLVDALQEEPQDAERYTWRRDFENGIVIVNPDKKPHSIDLNGTFRKIRGVVDPDLNDGSELTSVTVAARSGIILLKT